MPMGSHPKPFADKSIVLPNVESLAVPIAGFARNDRVVVWSMEPKLSVYSDAVDQPLGSTKELIEQPDHSAWLGNDLLAWGLKQITLLRDDGKTIAWNMNIGALPALAPLTQDETTDPDPQEIQAANPPGMIPGLRIRGGMRGMPVPMNIVVEPAPRQQAQGPEQIARVQPVGKLLLIATTSGRVACVDLKDHHLRWQVRLMDRAVAQLLAYRRFPRGHRRARTTTR